eukprot:4931055-Ditylum_brightwellii.AAC.1
MPLSNNEEQSSANAQNGDTIIIHETETQASASVTPSTSPTIANESKQSKSCKGCSSSSTTPPINNKEDE